MYLLYNEDEYKVIPSDESSFTLLIPRIVSNEDNLNDVIKKLTESKNNYYSENYEVDSSEIYHAISKKEADEILQHCIENNLDYIDCDIMLTRNSVSLTITTHISVEITSGFPNIIEKNDYIPHYLVIKR